MTASGVNIIRTNIHYLTLKEEYYTKITYISKHFKMTNFRIHKLAPFYINYTIKSRLHLKKNSLSIILIPPLFHWWISLRKWKKEGVLFCLLLKMSVDYFLLKHHFYKRHSEHIRGAIQVNSIRDIIFTLDYERNFSSRTEERK